MVSDVVAARAATDADADLTIPARAVAEVVMMTVTAALNNVATALVAIGEDASGVKPNMATYTTVRPAGCTAVSSAGVVAASMSA